MKYTIEPGRARVHVTAFISVLTAELIELIERRYPLRGPSAEWADYQTTAINLVVHYPDDIEAGTEVVIRCDRTPTKRGVWVRKVHITPVKRWRIAEGEDLPPVRDLRIMALRVMRWIGACRDEINAVVAACGGLRADDSPETCLEIDTHS